MGAVVHAYRFHPAHGSRAVTQIEMARWLGITQGQLSRIENGRNRIHDLDKLIHYARTLAIPPVLLWFELDDDPPPPQPGHTLRLPNGKLVAAATPSAEPMLADSLLTTLDQYVRTDQISGPRALLPVVTQQIRLIEQVHQASHGRTREKIRAVHARYAECLGWLYQDAGDLPTAREWSDIAYALAHDLGDRRLQSYILMRQSNLASDAGNPAHAIALASDALRHTGESTPRLRAMALRQLALGHARLGRADTFARTIDVAWHCADDANGTDADLAGYCTPGFIAVEAADCWIELGRPDHALARLETGLTDWQPQNRRDLGRGLALLARAQACTGQPEPALDAARHALAIAAETGSDRTELQLHRVARELAESGAADTAAELRVALRQSLR